MDKPIDRRGSSLGDLREFPEAARKQAGHHSFQKASRKTGKGDVEIAETRYRAVVRERQN